MELGELSRAIGQPWSILWPKAAETGREERYRAGAFTGGGSGSAGRHPTGQVSRNWHLRQDSAPFRHAQRRDRLSGVEAGGFQRRMITVGRAKTPSGTGETDSDQRRTPQHLGGSCSLVQREFRQAPPEQYLFPFGSPRAPRSFTSGYNHETRVDDSPGRGQVRCRLHDLRHTAATNMAEAGSRRVPCWR